MNRSQKYGRAGLVTSLALLSLALTGQLSATSAQAEEITYDPKRVSLKSVSGFSGKVEKKQPGNGAFLYGIETNEKSDKPCYMKLHWWRKTGAGKPETVTTQFWKGKCSKDMKSDKQVVYADAAAQRVAVSSLSVCNNDKSNHRLKGVELISHRIQGEVLVEGGNKQFARTNCKKWKAASKCAPGELAVGVDIHHQDDSITGLALRCAPPKVDGLPAPAASFDLKPATKSPKPGNRKASVVFFYFGDSKFETLFQEAQINLSKLFEAYDKNILLAHEAMPDWLSGHDKARAAADEVKVPSFENLARSLEQLADEGYVVDLAVFSHGLTDKFKGSKGYHGSTSYIDAEMIRALAQPGESYTGYRKLPIRAVYQMNCYGKSLNDDWLAIGAKVANGAPFVNFAVNSFNTFRRKWTGGESFGDSIAATDKKSAWTVMDALILADAVDSKKKGIWGGCPFPKTVLGKHNCARDYFTSRWVDDDEWQNNMSGKDYMRHSSDFSIRGDRKVTFSSKLSW